MILINVVQRFVANGQLEVKLHTYLSRLSLSHCVENLVVYANQYTRVFGPDTAMAFTFMGWTDLGVDFAVGPSTRDELGLHVLEELIANLKTQPGHFDQKGK